MWWRSHKQQTLNIIILKSYDFIPTFSFSLVFTSQMIWTEMTEKLYIYINDELGFIVEWMLNALLHVLINNKSHNESELNQNIYAWRRGDAKRREKSCVHEESYCIDLYEFVVISNANCYSFERQSLKFPYERSTKFLIKFETCPCQKFMVMYSLACYFHASIKPCFIH